VDENDPEKSRDLGIGMIIWTFVAGGQPGFLPDTLSLLEAALKNDPGDLSAEPSESVSRRPP